MATMLEHVNPLPSPTWNFLNLNEQSVEVPEVTAAPEGALEATIPAGTNALTCEQFGAEWAADQHPEMVARPAGGLGDEALAWLRENKTEGIMLEVPANTTIDEPIVVRMNAAEGAAVASRLALIVREGANAKVVIEAASAEPGEGVVGVSVSVIAERNARVHIATQQMLDAGWLYFDNIAARIGADAKIDVQQTILGSQKGYLGVSVALEGDRSDFTINTDYLTTADHLLDFNYLIRHLGRNSTSTFTANGVMTGSSRKNLRGTIDLVRGAKGAKGHEMESVLLTNKKVRNKSLPTILCDEDDVQGDHGATIGNIAPSQLRYLNTRGLSDQQAEALFTRSVFEKAEICAFDETSRKAVQHLAETVFDSDGTFIDSKELV